MLQKESISVVHAKDINLKNAFYVVSEQPYILVSSSS